MSSQVIFPQKLTTFKELMDSLKEMMGPAADKRNLQPGGRPLIKKILSAPLCHTLYIRDEKHPGRLHWPVDASHYQVWIKVGGEPASDPGEYHFADDFKTLTAKLNFLPADQGKTIHYMIRWVNNFNVAGPWSKIFSAMIR